MAKSKVKDVENFLVSGVRPHPITLASSQLACLRSTTNQPKSGFITISWSGAISAIAVYEYGISFLSA
jgi:hypothetical protein